VTTLINLMFEIQSQVLYRLVLDSEYSPQLCNKRLCEHGNYWSERNPKHGKKVSLQFT